MQKGETREERGYEVGVRIRVRGGAESRKRGEKSKEG